MADLVGRVEANELQINVKIVGSGPAGRAGYTPVKGVDYFDGKDGKDGAPGRDGVDGKDGSDGAPGRDGRDGVDGKDGVSVTHEWDGTILKITSTSGTTSADLKGDPGQNGSAGYTPVRGTDYWTEADVEEIKSYVDQQLGVIENGTY